MNPEFQRNLWLDASPRRAIWAGVTVLLVYFAVALLSRDSRHGAAIFTGVGIAVFVVCAVLWAARAAGSSVLTEVAERTWDFQRLSSLTAWEMTWGKLFGATFLASCAGMTGIVVYLLAARPASPWLVILMLAGALMVQSVSFMAALVGVRKARAEGRVARPGGIIGGLIIGYFLLSSLAAGNALKQGGLHPGFGWFGRQGMVSWWGMTLSVEVFWSISLLVFAGFALAGAWRLMRLELQMRNEPLVWPLFLLVLAAWVAGYRAGPMGHGASVAAAGMAMCLAAYAAAFIEPADRVAVRRFARLAVQGKAAEAARIAPAPLFPLAFAAILTLISFGIPAEGIATAYSPSALLAFLVRDLGIIAYFRFGPRPQRGDFGAIVALALIYGVGGIFGRVAGGPAGAAFFTPSGGEYAVFSVVSALVQAAIAWFLAAQRIRAPETSVSAPPSGPASAPA
jgi:hypothetical protein